MLAVPRIVPLLLVLAVAFGACRRPPPAIVAMEPRPNPPLASSRPPADNPRERLRQNRWLAQFWEELTPAQRRRVEARMRRAQPSAASDRESVGSTWDTLGLAERDRLVFGGAAPGQAAQPAATVGSPGRPVAPVGAEANDTPAVPQ